MSRWYDYPNCRDVERHQQEGREDARHHSREHQPSEREERDCQLAYADARRKEIARMERREEERAQEEAYERECYERARAAREEEQVLEQDQELSNE